jgi:hypothetical protein
MNEEIMKFMASQESSWMRLFNKLFEKCARLDIRIEYYCIASQHEIINTFFLLANWFANLFMWTSSFLPVIRLR